MYSRPAKLITTARTPSPDARSQASMSVASLVPVRSPTMSMTRAASDGERTSNIVDPHEVRQPGDLEDLPVVGAQTARRQSDAAGARVGQQLNDQGNPRAVDVVRAREVEHDPRSA